MATTVPFRQIDSSSDPDVPTYVDLEIQSETDNSSDSAQYTLATNNDHLNIALCDDLVVSSSTNDDSNSVTGQGASRSTSDDKADESLPSTSATSVASSTPLAPSESTLGKMIIDTSKFNKSFIVESSFEAPKRLGYYSCLVKSNDDKWTYLNDKSSLRYLGIDPNGQEVGINLSKGDTKKDTPEPDQMNILRWVSENKLYVDLDATGTIADIICDSRILGLIMTTPYNTNSITSWSVVAVKLRDSIIVKEIGSTKWDKSSCNLYLEKKITRRTDGKTSHPDIATDSFYIVSKTKIDGQTILYSCRTACVANKAHLDKSPEEMETALVTNRDCLWNKNSKTKKDYMRNEGICLWVLGLLNKSASILCGEIEPNKWVKCVNPIKMEDLLKPANCWSPRTCTNFLGETLSFIRSMVTEELTPYRFDYTLDSQIVCSKFTEPVENIIPLWYIKNQSPVDE